MIITLGAGTPQTDETMHLSSLLLLLLLDCGLRACCMLTPQQLYFVLAHVRVQQG